MSRRGLKFLDKLDAVEEKEKAEEGLHEKERQ
jgi:hypothetical protein